MSGFGNFIIAGRAPWALKNAGKINNVTILTRSDSKNLDEYKNAGAKITTVEYGSAESLKNAITGADVVISTLNSAPAALQAQHLLAEQAKAAGVKLFVPSEFGDATDRENLEGVFAIKQSVHRKLKELDLPYASSSRSGNVTVGLDGNAVNSFTTQRDIGRFVAYALTNLPRSKLERRIFRIEAELFQPIFKEYEERTGKKLNVTYRSESELRAAISKNPEDRVSVLQLDWGLGGGLVGRLDQLSVSDYPDWNPKTIADVQ
ncbi:NmrA-like family-domain-containing protein [Russula aff. rugulosa BPL654]|nr:NmrA-like family-domain-containing protein [Russula aff. rugulosa BPL654]